MSRLKECNSFSDRFRSIQTRNDYQISYFSSNLNINELLRVLHDNDVINTLNICKYIKRLEAH